MSMNGRRVGASNETGLSGTSVPSESARDRDRAMSNSYDAAASARRKHDVKAHNDKRRATERAQALAARPREVAAIDRSLRAIEILTLALDAATDTSGTVPGGALRRSFESLAVRWPDAPASVPKDATWICLEHETGAEYWTAPRQEFRTAPVFELHFGFPGDVTLSRERFGLSSHLFGDEPHDADAVREYIDYHRGYIEHQRAQFVRSRTFSPIRSGGMQTVAPSWS